MEVKGQFSGPGLSFHRVGPGDRMQGHQARCLYLLSHIARLETFHRYKSEVWLPGVFACFYCFNDVRDIASKSELKGDIVNMGKCLQ